MEKQKTLYVTERKDWRLWLKENYNKEKEIWLIYYRKSSNKPRISYNDAVEEALCYGWIDGILKRVDEESFAQRFSPRRANSNLSEMNKERIRRLIKQKKMTSIGLKAVSHAFDKNKDPKLIVAEDLKKALKSDKQTWKNFENFSEGYKKVRIGYIEDARGYNQEMFKNRLNHFVRMTAKNKKFGMVQ